MGITTLLTAALKHVSWGQVAQIALNYGPDLFRKLRGEGAQEQALEPDTVEVDPLVEMSLRISGLEDVVIRQGELLARQESSIRELEENCRILQARLKIVSAVSAVLALLVLIMFILLVRR